MYEALIIAIVGIWASLLTINFTKRKEREAEWRAKKLSYYERFISANNSIIGDVALPEAKIESASSVNQLHLVASNGVLIALHEMLHEISESNPNKSIDRQDVLWSQLVWEIRKDLNDPPTKKGKTLRR